MYRYFTDAKLAAGLFNPLYWRVGKTVEVKSKNESWRKSNMVNIDEVLSLVTAGIAEEITEVELP